MYNAHFCDSSDFSMESSKPPCEESELVGLKRKCDTVSDNKDEDKPVSKMGKQNELWEPVEIPPDLSKRQRKKFIKKVLWETKWKPLKRYVSTGNIKAYILYQAYKAISINLSGRLITEELKEAF